VEKVPVEEALRQLLHPLPTALHKLGVKLSLLFDACRADPFQQPLFMNILELPDTLLPRFGIAFLPPRLGVQIYDETAPFA